MADILITVSEDDLYSNKKLHKILLEYQNQGLFNIEKDERKPYKLKPLQKSEKEFQEQPSPEDFVKAVKFIVNHAAKKNGEQIQCIENGGKAGNYIFWLDNKGWCKMMDMLLAEHRKLIVAALKKKKKPDSVNLLAPFIGAIINKGCFQKTQIIRKIDLIPSFTEYYGKPCSSVKTQLSTTYSKRDKFNDLVEKAVEIAKEIADKP